MDAHARQGVPCPDDILKKCAALMAKQGYHGTTMRDLARTTGRSLAGLYHHFSSKEELLFLINERGFSLLLENAERLIAGYQAGVPGSRAARHASGTLLCELIGAHLGHFGSHLNEMRVVTSGTLSMSPAHGEVVRQLKQRYTQVMAFAVGEYTAARRETLKPGEIERKTYLLFGMMNWIFGWYSFDEHGSVEELAEEVYLTFTKGCLASRQSSTGGN